MNNDYPTVSVNYEMYQNAVTEQIDNKISNLEKGIKRLEAAKENLQTVKSKTVEVEEPLNEGGLLIDNQMPFQFYIDEIIAEIDDCNTKTNEEINDMNNEIAALKVKRQKQLEENYEAAMQELSNNWGTTYMWSGY